MSAPQGIDRHTFLKRTGALGAAVAAGGLGPVLDGGMQDIAHAASAVTPSRGGKITLAIVDQPVNMDAADGELYSSIEVYDNIFSKLINVTKDFRFVPNIVDPFVKTLGRGNLRWRHLLSPADWQGCVNR